MQYCLLSSRRKKQIRPSFFVGLEKFYLENLSSYKAIYGGAEIRSQEQESILIMDDARVDTIFEDKISKGFPIIVAEVDNTIAGFGYYSEFRFRAAYQFTVEHSVYADNRYTGKGVGKVLLTELIRLAKAQKLHTMIGVIDSENTTSIAFHKKFGFEEAGFIKESGYKFDRWLHSVFMQKML